MSLETRLRSTGQTPGGGGSASAGSGTVNAGTTNYMAYYRDSTANIWSSQILTSTGPGIAPFNFSTLTSQIVSPSTGDFWTLDSAGKYIYHYISGTAFYTRLTHTDGSVAAVSGGLAGTGPFYLLHTSGNATLPLSKIISAGNNITIRTDTNAVFIDANTGAAGAWAYGTLGVGSGGTGNASFLRNSVIFSNGTNLLGDTSRLIYDITNSSLTLGTNSGISGQDVYVKRGSSVSATFQTTDSSQYAGFYLNAADNNWQVYAGGNASADVGRFAIFRSGLADTSLDIDSLHMVRVRGLGVRPVGSNQLIISGSSANVRGLLGLSHGGIIVGSVGPVILNSGGQGTMLINSGGTQTGLAWVATGGGASNSGGLAGTDGLILVYSNQTLWPNSKVLKAGSSVTTHTDSTSFYINATTSTAVNSAGRNYYPFLVQQAKLYSNTSAALIDAGTAWWRLLYSSLTQQYAVWQFVVPPDYSGTPYLQISWAGNSSIAAVRSTTWTIDQWSIPHDLATVAYLNMDTFGGANSVTIGLSAGYTSGVIQNLTIPLTTTVSFAANVITQIRVTATGNFVGSMVLAGMNLGYSR